MATAEPVSAQPGSLAERERFGRSVVYEGEILRHTVYVRVVHWAVALTFVLSLLSGFAMFTPWLYRWLSPLFGGGPLVRLLHPWFGIAFLVLLPLLVLRWRPYMRWTEQDSRWMRRLRAYVTNAETTEPDEVDKFNAGQKSWFWILVGSSIIFLVTGILLWFPGVFGRRAAWLSYFFHDLAAIVMLGGFLVHIYEGTGGIPGTFRSMTRGTVREEWAWTHHSAWYRKVTGRDPVADRATAQKRMSGQ